MSLTNVYELFEGMSEGTHSDRQRSCKRKLLKAKISLNLAGENLNAIFNRWINGEICTGLVEASKRHGKANIEYMQALADYMHYSEK